MHKTFIRTAALLGALSVILGAFAAHGLKNILSEDALKIFETGVRYQFYHVFALILTGIMYKEFPVKSLRIAGTLFIIGTILFSGSLYLLTYIKASALDNLNWIGAVTPFGGLCFIAGWLFMVAAFLKKRICSKPQ